MVELSEVRHRWTYARPPVSGDAGRALLCGHGNRRHANEGDTASDHTLQIRVTSPEPPILNRNHSHWFRTTKILDYDAWCVPHQPTFHLTARCFGNHVELWIAGQKMLSGIIPADHPGVQRERIGLWTFETWCDFDNIQVTQLVPVTDDGADR